MRLIDADALKKEWHMGDKCEECERDARDCQYAHILSIMDFCSILDDAPTVAKGNTVLGNSWISAKDDLPHDGQHCVVYYAGVTESGERCYTQDVADYLMGCWWFSWSNCNGLKPDVVAWYPLPQPPEEEKNAADNALDADSDT